MAIDVVAASARQARPRLRVAEAAPECHTEFDRAYWIAHCEGYRVDGREGRIGFVDEVRTDPAEPGTPRLAIRIGRLGRRLIVVSASEVLFIGPRSQRIWLRSPVSLTESEAA